MRLNVVLAASARLAASLLLLLSAAPAVAGDRAGFNALGFSADGRYFAFEEYGVQDGSGFPYSNIYALDLPADRWVAGAPFSVRLDADDASLALARQQALQKAGAALDQFSLDVPAELIAHVGDGEPDDGQVVSFGQPGYGLAEPQNVRTLALDTFPLAASDTPCGDYTDQPTEGFALLLDGVEIYRDRALPKSRGCALGYRIHAIAAPFPIGLQEPVTVAIISVYPFGFEGPDRRFIAVPIDTP
jgi:predicted secreted protein